MKKLFAMVAVVCLGLLGSVISTATPVHAQAQPGTCLEALNVIDISPASITESHLKEHGVTFTVQGLPPYAVGQVFLFQGDLVNINDAWGYEWVDPNSPRAVLPYGRYVGNVEPKMGFVVADRSGVATFTLGGKANTDEDIEHPPGFEEDYGELEEYSWTSTLPTNKSDSYIGNYVLGVGFYNLLEDEELRFVQDGHKVSVMSAREFEEYEERRASDLVEQGMSEDEAEEELWAYERNFTAPSVCTPFVVGEDSATSPEPEPSETPEPTPEPEPSETPEPEPSETPEPEPSETPEPSQEPEPEPSETPEPEPSETPEPEPSESPEPTPEPEPSETPEATPEPSPSESVTPTPEPEPEQSVTPEPSPEPSEAPSVLPESGDTDAPAPVREESSVPESSSGPDALPRTGAQTVGALVAGGVLLAVGIVTTVLSRRSSRSL